MLPQHKTRSCPLSSTKLDEMFTSALRRNFIIIKKPQIFGRFSTTAFRMGVTKEVISEGDKTTYAKSGDNIIMEYTGTLTDGTQYVHSFIPSFSMLCSEDVKMGSTVQYSAVLTMRNRFDSSRGRAPFAVKIGTGRVIRGW